MTEERILGRKVSWLKEAVTQSTQSILCIKKEKSYPTFAMNTYELGLIKLLIKLM